MSDRTAPLPADRLINDLTSCRSIVWASFLLMNGLCTGRQLRDAKTFEGDVDAMVNCSFAYFRRVYRCLPPSNCHPAL